MDYLTTLLTLHVGYVTSNGRKMIWKEGDLAHLKLLHQYFMEGLRNAMRTSVRIAGFVAEI
jgi:hypothetical protein